MSGKVIKKTRIVNISSNSGVKLNGAMNSKIKFNVPSFTEIGKNIISQEFSILNFGIPNSTYNINKDNNTLEIFYRLHAHVFEILPAYYSITSLISYLNTHIPDGFAFTYSASQGKITVTNSIYPFSILANSTIRNVMGISEEASQDSEKDEVTNLHTVYLQNVISLFPVQVICVRSGQFQLNNHCNMDQTSNVILSILNNVGQNQMLVYNNYNSDMKYNLSNSNLTDFTIDITDLSSNNLDLNGCHWHASLMFLVTLEIPPNAYDWDSVTQNNKKRTVEEITQLLDELEN